jgi:crossover junction endodeoxyribonuclease RusA
MSYWTSTLSIKLPETLCSSETDFMYEIELPFPPSTNSLYRNVKGRSIISEKGREYKASVISHMSKYGLANTLLNMPLCVKIELYEPDNRKRDVDNYTKILFDSLTKARFWTDDSIILEKNIRKMGKSDKPRVVLSVYPDMESGFN